MEKETRLLLAIVLSFLFMTVEFIGGYIANSIAIYSDAAHLLTDVAGFLIALIATITAKHKGSRHLTYGYVRAEVFGALFSIISLWIITVYLFYEASRRTLSWFRGNGEAVDGFFMFVVAVFGIMVNISLGLLFQDEHGGDLHPGHSHDHAHGSAIEGHHDDDHGHHDDNHGHHDNDHGHHDNDHGHHDNDHGHHDHHHNHNGKPTTTDSTEASPLLTIGSHYSSNTDAQPFAFVKQQQRHDHDHDHKPVSDKHEHEHKHEHSSHVDLESYQNEGSATVVHPHPNATFSSFHGNHDHHNSHDSHGRDVNLEAAYMHVITDLIQSIGVAIAGAILWRYPSFQIIDPMCTFIFGYIALTATIPLTKKIVMILFEGVPSNVEWDSVMKGLVSIPNVEDVHDLHIWSINTNRTSLTCHIRTKAPDDTLRSAHSICKKFGIDHVTIQVHDITKGSNQYCYSTVCDASSSFNIHSTLEGNDVKPCSSVK